MLVFPLSEVDFKVKFVKPLKMIIGRSVKDCKVFRLEDDCETETTEDESPLQVSKEGILDVKPNCC